MRHNIKRSIALLLLAASLVLPSSAFAASTGDTTENGITGPVVTLSLVAPVSITYASTGSLWVADYTTAGQGLTGIDTNATNGLTVSVKTDAFTGNPSGSTATTVRSMVLGVPGQTTGLIVKGADVPAPGFTNSATSKPMVTSTGPVSGGSITFEWSAPQSAFTTVGATYTSALHFTATAN